MVLSVGCHDSVSPFVFMARKAMANYGKSARVELGLLSFRFGHLSGKYGLENFQF